MSDLNQNDDEISHTCTICFDDGGYIIFTDTDSQIPPEPNNLGFIKIAPDTVSQSNYYELTLTIKGEGSVFPRTGIVPDNKTYLGSF